MNQSLRSHRSIRLDPPRLRAVDSLTMDEAEFSAPAIAITQRPVSPTLRLTVFLLIALVTTGIVWASVSRIDIIAEASGQVIPSSGTKTIASVDTAIVQAIYVREGQSVRVGDPLVALDASPLKSDVNKATARLEASAIEMARAQALIDSITEQHPPRPLKVPDASAEVLREAQAHLNGDYLEYETKLAQIQSDIVRYEAALPVAQEREAIFRRLLQTHDVSREDWLAKDAAQIDLAGELAKARDARAAWGAQSLRAAYDAYHEAEKLAADARQDAARAASHVAWLTLRSPTNGVVQQLAVHTIGGVVPATQPLMLVVPSDSRVQVEAYALNKDVGFIRPEQTAQVKFVPFDFTRYGTVSARVVSISQDAMQGSEIRRDGSEPGSPGGRYLVRLALETNAMDVDGRRQPLEPGMSVNVEIRTGRRRVIEYLLSPLIRHASESLHER